MKRDRSTEPAGPAARRGLALGLNEESGYLAVSAAAAGSRFLAPGNRRLHNRDGSVRTSNDISLFIA
jgi:hypothetical protein